MNPQNCIVIKTQSATIKKIERNGKPTLYFNEQSAAIETGDDFPKPFKLTLGEGDQPYPPGRYLLDPSSLDVGDFQALKVGRNVKLIPLPSATASKVA
ncbi:single-stranded DNA-binding protein [Lysobacter sp. D1-1-M9]